MHFLGDLRSFGNYELNLRIFEIFEMIGSFNFLGLFKKKSKKIKVIELKFLKNLNKGKILMILSKLRLKTTNKFIKKIPTQGFTYFPITEKILINIQKYLQHCVEWVHKTMINAEE